MRVECAVDESMNVTDNPTRVQLPTLGELCPIMECVLDTGTQITAMGRHHAEMMGINCTKLSQTSTSISCLSGEEIIPLGSFYATITGIKKTETGKRRTML